MEGSLTGFQVQGPGGRHITARPMEAKPVHSGLVSIELTEASRLSFLDGSQGPQSPRRTDSREEAGSKAWPSPGGSKTW